METFVVKKSVWSEITFFRIILCILIIPIFFLVYRIIESRFEKWELKGNKVIHTSGLLSKRTEQTVLTGIFAVNIDQSLKGRIFNYGDVFIDVGGLKDLYLTGVSKPENIKRSLEEYIGKQKISAVAIN